MLNRAEGIGVADNTPILSGLFVSDTKPIDHIGLYQDNTQLVCPHFKDLVSNTYHYHNNLVKSSDEVFLGDDSNLNNYESITDLVDSILDNPQSYADGGTVTWRVPTSAIFTADAELGNKLGADRLHRFYPKSPHIKKYDDWTKDGWKQNGSPALLGWVRWIYNPHKEIIGFVISKIAGSGRFYMKKRSNAGEDSELLMQLQFQPINPDMEYKDCQKIEIQGFKGEQQHQVPHDQETKFLAGVKAGDKQWVALRDLLSSNNLEYRGVVEKTTNEKPEFELSSPEGFTFGKEGKPGLEIRAMHMINFEYALDTLKKIQLERERLNVTEFKKGSKTVPFNEISNSALRVFLRAFRMLTDQFTDEDTQNQITALLDKDSLQEVLLWRYTGLNARKTNVQHPLSELNQKDLVKDFYFFGIKSFLRDVLQYVEEDRQNRIKSKNPTIRRYINACDSLLRGQAKEIVENRA